MLSQWEMSHFISREQHAGTGSWERIQSYREQAGYWFVKSASLAVSHMFSVHRSSLLMEMSVFKMIENR